MSIHHATATRAEKMGVILKEKGDAFEAHWAKRNQRLTGENAKLLLDEMSALIDILTNHRSFKFKVNDNGTRTVSVKLGDETASCTNDYLHRAFETVKKDWLEYRSELSDEETEAEEEEAEDDEGSLGGSVVAARYRAKYAEAGHPTHCGDWLATTLINLTANDAGTNITQFEAICTVNGVDLAKYDRVSHGWQGRIRMTGRNMLARRVFFGGGALHLPDGSTLHAPKEWMDAQKYKAPKRVEDPAPVVTPTPAPVKPKRAKKAA